MTPRIEYERMIIGAALADPDCIPQLAEGLVGYSWEGHLEESTWRTILKLGPATSMDAVHRAANGNGLTADQLNEALEDAGISLTRPEQRSHCIRQMHEAATVEKLRKAATADNPDPKRVIEELHRILNNAPALEEDADPEPLDVAGLLREGLPPPAWIVRNWLEESDIALVAGYAGCGKTTAIYDLALALVQGRPWAGNLEVPQKRRVMIIDEEMGKGKVLKYIENLGATPNQLDGLDVFSIQGLELDSDTGLARIKRLIEKHKSEVVIIDSSQHVMRYKDENDSVSITDGFKRIFILREMGVTIIIIHHLRKPMFGEKPTLHSIRGSSAFSTQASNVWVAGKTSDGSGMKLTQVKTRSGGKDQRVIIRMDTRPDGTCELTSEPLDEDQMAIDEARDWVLTKLQESKDPIRTAELKEAAKPASQPFRTVQRALKEMVEDGTLTKPKNGLYQLTRRPEDHSELPF